MNKKIENELLKQIKHASDIGEIPVAAILTIDGNILCSAINTREKEKNVLGHAEINVIKKASKLLKTWNLSNCELFVTLEPCEMCKQVIKQAKIKNVTYFVENNKKINYKTVFYKCDNNISREIIEEMQKIFENKR